MTNSFHPNISIMGGIQGGRFDTGIGNIAPMRLDSMDGASGSNFKGVMSGLVQNLNQGVNAPDQLLKDAMTGSNDVDIHDVMTAMAKAELSINVATQVTTKVIQAYDKIMQIQV